MATEIRGCKKSEQRQRKNSLPKPRDSRLTNANPIAVQNMTGLAGHPYMVTAYENVASGTKTRHFPLIARNASPPDTTILIDYMLNHRKYRQELWQSSQKTWSVTCTQLLVLSSSTCWLWLRKYTKSKLRPCSNPKQPTLLDNQVDFKPALKQIQKWHHAWLKKNREISTCILQFNE